MAWLCQKNMSNPSNASLQTEDVNKLTPSWVVYKLGSKLKKALVGNSISGSNSAVSAQWRYQSSDSKRKTRSVKTEVPPDVIKENRDNTNTEWNKRKLHTVHILQKHWGQVAKII